MASFLHESIGNLASWRKGEQPMKREEQAHSDRALEVEFGDRRNCRRSDASCDPSLLASEEKEEIDSDETDTPLLSTDSIHLANLELTLSWQSFEIANLRSVLEVQSNECAQALARAKTAEEELEQLKAENVALRMRLEEMQANGPGLVGSVKKIWNRKGSAGTALFEDDNCSFSPGGSSGDKRKSLPLTDVSENLTPIVEELIKDSQADNKQKLAKEEKDKGEDMKIVEHRPSWLSGVFSRRKEGGVADENGATVKEGRVARLSEVRPSVPKDRDDYNDGYSSISSSSSSLCLSANEEESLNKFNSSAKFDEVDYRDSSPFAQPQKDRHRWMKSAVGLFQKQKDANEFVVPEPVIRRSMAA